MAALAWAGLVGGCIPPPPPPPPLTTANVVTHMGRDPDLVTRDDGHNLVYHYRYGAGGVDGSVLYAFKDDSCIYTVVRGNSLDRYPTPDMMPAPWPEIYRIESARCLGQFPLITERERQAALEKERLEKAKEKPTHWFWFF